MISFQSIIFYIILNLAFGKNQKLHLTIFNLMNNFMTNFKDKSFTIALSLDLRKAFDLVDPNILLGKLYRYGFRENAYDFLKSYLTYRFQYVSMDESE